MTGWHHYYIFVFYQFLEKDNLSGGGPQLRKSAEMWHPSSMCECREVTHPLPKVKKSQKISFYFQNTTNIKKSALPRCKVTILEYIA